MGKWNEPPAITSKAGLHTKAAMLCICWDWKGILHYELLLENQMINSNKYCSKLDQQKWWKCLEFVNRKHRNFHQDTSRPYVSLMIRQKLLQLSSEVLIHLPYSPDIPPLHPWIFIYFGLYKILLMEKIPIPWKTVEGTWNSSLFKKIKRFGKMELWSCLANGRR